MSSVNKQINQMVKNMQDTSKFIDQWINYLESTPWADGECLSDNLKYENSLSWPVCFIQYETKSVDEFQVEGHVPMSHLWNENDKRPDIGYLERLAGIFDIDKDEMFEKIMKLPNDFHEKFYKGYKEKNEGEPVMHGIYQRLLNETLNRVYRTEIEYKKRNYLDVDFGIMICMRVNNLFSNKPVEIHFENYIHAMETDVLDLGSYSFEQMGLMFTNGELVIENGIRQSTEPHKEYYCKVKFKECLESLRKKAKKKIENMFRDQEHIEREEIAYEETIEDERIYKWLNHLYYSTNSVKIDL